jgi:hypothetical protein
MRKCAPKRVVYSAESANILYAFLVDLLALFRTQSNRKCCEIKSGKRSGGGMRDSVIEKYTKREKLENKTENEKMRIGKSS